jgi:hypothetical protein
MTMTATDLSKQKKVIERREEGAGAAGILLRAGSPLSTCAPTHLILLPQRAATGQRGAPS